MKAPIEQIRCASCGTLRTWEGSKCLTPCPCTAATAAESEIGVRRLEVTPNAVELDLTPPQRMIAALVGGFREQLQGAKNYVEMTLSDPEEHETYVVTIQKQSGKTPHQLRQAAEAQVAGLEKRVAHLKAELKEYGYAESDFE